MDILPNENNPNAPNCEQIRRACTLYGLGAGPADFVHAFGAELENEGIFLAYAAAQAFHEVGMRMMNTK